MIKVSIVVPAYNVEMYLDECLTSCLRQDLAPEEYEVVCVDDGSADGTPQVLARFASVANVKVVRRANGGLSAARNTGLAHARGEYVWFVDGDDWIAENCLGRLYAAAVQDDLEMLCFNREQVFPDGSRRRGRFGIRGAEGVIGGPEFVLRADVSPGACFAFFRRAFLQREGLRFLEGILHEDQEFVPRAQYLARRIAYVDEIVYAYRQRGGSIMRSCQDRLRVESLLAVADSLDAFARERVAEEDCRAAFMRKVSFAFRQALAHDRAGCLPLSTFKGRPYYPLKISYETSAKEMLKVILCNVSIRLFLLARNLGRRP